MSMSYTSTSDESITIDGVPLNTPAWIVTDTSDLLNGAPNRGGDIIVPGKRGTVARRRNLDATEVVLPLVIFGDRATDGTPYSDVRQGLLENIDALKKALRPNYARQDGTRELVAVIGGSTRYARVHTSVDMQLTAAGPGAARGTITITIPGGVLRGANETTTLSGTGDKTINVGGTAEIYDATFTIAGTASAIRIANLSIDPSGNTYLLYTAPVTGGLLIDAAAYRVFNTTGGGMQDVSVYASTGGTAAWVPLLPGENVLRLTYNTASAGIQTTIGFAAAWA